MTVRRARWDRGRKTPYTSEEIGLVGCIRCGSPSRHQWQVCSDANVFRPICRGCDVALNRLVLWWMGHPKKDKLMRRYERVK